MVLFVELFTVATRSPSIGVWREAQCDALLLQSDDHPISLISPVGDQMLGSWEIREQVFCAM